MSSGHAHETSVLVVDDDSSLLQSTSVILEAAGYKVKTALNAADGYSLLEQDSFEIVLCDYRLPETSGLAFIRDASRSGKNVELVLMTAYGNPELAAHAMEEGATDYLKKPFTGDDLVLTVRKIEARLRQKLGQLGSAKARVGGALRQFPGVVLQSESMKRLFSTIERLSPYATTVLITGESGTGKELIAKAIHYHSPRRNKPFVAVNCGAIPEALLESEIFGHAKGSFTDATRDKRGLFEEANGGTLFLDEIGEMPLHLQVKILRALQERSIRPVGSEHLVPVDVRIIAATLRDLEEDVISGRFREDLYYRLNVVSLDVPPLRVRPNDIPSLVEHFLSKHGKRLGLGVSRVDPDAMQALMNYGWKGNVRELENCIERSMVLTDGESITLASLPPIVRSAADHGKSIADALGGDTDNLSIKQRTRSLEIDLIRRALHQTGGNRTRAAKVLEISHRALLYKIKEYGLGE